MNQAQYRISIQTDGTSLFAKVTLSARLTNEQNGLNITCESDYGKEWFSAVHFGIRYGSEQIFHRRKHFKGLIVKIDEIAGTVVDTREIAMVYVAAMALWKALEIYPEEMPKFDRITRTFTFPE